MTRYRFRLEASMQPPRRECAAASNGRLLLVLEAVAELHILPSDAALSPIVHSDSQSTVAATVGRVSKR
jgi:hypothetical protein